MFQHALWGFKHPSTTIESRNQTSSTTVCPIQTSAHLTLTMCLSNMKPQRAHLSTTAAVHGRYFVASMLCVASSIPAPQMKAEIRPAVPLSVLYRASAHLTLTKCLSNMKPDRAHLSTTPAVHGRCFVASMLGVGSNIPAPQLKAKIRPAVPLSVLAQTSAH